MSIAQVAKSAGVSKSTVSRVINRGAGVTPEVMRHVQDTMMRLGYQPPTLRRGRKPVHRKGIRTGNIALVALGFDTASLARYSIFQMLLPSIEQALHEDGLTLVMAGLVADRPLPPALAGNQVDGLLLLGSYLPPPAIWERLERFPVVGLVRGCEEYRTRFDRITYDNTGVGQMAAQYLLGRGHQRVAFLNIFKEHVAFAERQRNFVDAVAAAGGEVIELVSTEGIHGLPANIASYGALVRKMAASRERITGVFVPNDAQLPLLYQALEAQGLKVSRDLDVIGCDAEEASLDQLSPRPATIDIGLREIGRRGVKHLLWRMAHPDERPFTTTLLQPLLVEGNVAPVLRA